MAPSPMPAPVPASPLHLIAFDAAGHQLEDIGVAIQAVTFAGAPTAGGTFVGPDSSRCRRCRACPRRRDTGP